MVTDQPNINVKEHLCFVSSALKEPKLKMQVGLQTYKKCKYFFLQALFACSINIHVSEVLFRGVGVGWGVNNEVFMIKIL